MSKTKIGFLVLLLAVVLGCSLMLSHYKEMYKVLPLQQAEPLPLGAVPPEEVFDQWVDFKSLKGDFHVFFPFFPQNAKEKVTDPKTKEIRKYDMYISEKGDGTIFMLTLITLPKVPEKESGESYLKNLIDDMVNGNENNQLISSKKVKFKNHDGIDFVIDNKELLIKGLLFIKEDIIAILTRISKIADRNDEEFTFFSNSFDFNAQKEDK
jgi:hypothetical protein